MDPFKSFTVSIWFKTSRACSSMGTLVAKGALLGTWGAYRDSNTGGQWTMQFTSSAGLGFHILNTDGIVISANSYETFCDGAWHLAEAAAATTGVAFSTSIFYGHLDDLKVWEYVRSEAELLEDYLMSVAVNTTDSGLRAWYRFNDAVGVD
eukprot:scaffold295639_cov50-Prasinocladus_malaysianus.AAC.1